MLNRTCIQHLVLVGEEIAVCTPDHLVVLGSSRVRQYVRMQVDSDRTGNVSVLWSNAWPASIVLAGTFLQGRTRLKLLQPALPRRDLSPIPCATIGAKLLLYRAEFLPRIRDKLFGRGRKKAAGLTRCSCRASCKDCIYKSGTVSGVSRKCSFRPVP
jgi:hypothetical protein